MHPFKDNSTGKLLKSWIPVGIAGAFFVLSLFPFVYVAQYTHPSADDYAYAVEALEKGPLQSQIHWYQTWSGRYTATAILSFSPLYFHNLTLYKLLPFFWISMVIWAVKCLLQELFHPISQRRLWTYSLGLSTLFFSYMPEPTEGIFWYAGTGTYQTANALFLFIYAWLLKANRITSTFRYAYICISAMGAFLLVGLNETSMLMQGVLISGIWLVQIRNQRKWSSPVGLIALASFLGIAIVVMAPGNAVRIANFPTSQKLWALVETGAYSGFLFWKWILITPIPLLIVLGLGLSSDQLPKIRKDLQKISLLMSWGAFLAILFMGTFVGFWSLGFRPPPRTLNVVYMVFLIGLFLNFVHTFHAYKHKFPSPTLPKISQYLLLFAGLSYYFSPFNQSSIAYKQLISGRLAHFDRKMTERYELIQNTPEDHIQVPPISEIDANFVFYSDISQDSSYWANQAYATYFRKQSIILDEKATSP